MKTSVFTRLRQRAVDMANEKRFVRFLLVGTLNTAFSYLVYALLLLVGLHYAAANLGAVVLGIIFSFKTQGVLVFRDPRNALFAKYEGLAIGQKKREVGEAVPLGRMGRPEDYGAPAVFLASSDSDYIVAQTLNVDGGNWMS